MCSFYQLETVCGESDASTMAGRLVSEKLALPHFGVQVGKDFQSHIDFSLQPKNLKPFLRLVSSDQPFGSFRGLAPGTGAN
jgi:hypothetical protein